MAGNDRVLLEAIITKRKQEQGADLADDDFFELFTAENILKQEALTYDELQSGLVGSGGDGGIDAAYFLADGRLIREDTDPDDFRKKPTFEIYLVQAKRSEGFSEGPIDKFISVTENLFDLEKDVGEFEKLYNDDIRSLFRSFRSLYIALAGQHPSLSVTYYYASKGSTNDVHPNTAKRVDELKTALNRHFPDAEFDFAFAGAAELLALARKRPPETLTLPITEMLAAATGGYVALTRLSDLNAFLRNEDGKPFGHIFDENVRAYQGSVEVNKGIKDTLQNPANEDFWWLNNGVTILAQEASQVGKAIKISDPQIINGLQTSTEILSYFDSGEKNDDRHVLVKIVQSTSSETRDKVIKATNSQTGVQPASLRATDSIQRNIEEALLRDGFYYDRQKNFYKNEGRPLGSIIGIAEMAQTVMAVLLQRPNDARARPSSLIKDDGDYARIFNDAYDVKIYTVCTKIKKTADQALRQIDDLGSGDRNNLLYYVLTLVAMTLTSKPSPSADDIASLNLDKITLETVELALAIIRPLYEGLGGDEKVAKGRELVNKVKEVAV